jgi:hypothetical protein
MQNTIRPQPNQIIGSGRWPQDASSEEKHNDSLSAALSERAIAIVNPLRNFLDGIELINS